jgi:GxxExxY protein
MNLILKEECYKIVGICMEIHRILGSGLLESVYKDALEYELSQHKIPYEREKMFEIAYKNIILEHKFYADFVVYDNIIIEIKAVGAINDAHKAQTINYVRLSKGRLGIIINFGQPSLEYQRVVA